VNKDFQNTQVYNTAAVPPQRTFFLLDEPNVIHFSHVEWVEGGAWDG